MIWLLGGEWVAGGQLVWGSPWPAVGVTTAICAALVLSFRPNRTATALAEAALLGLAGAALVVVASRVSWVAEGERTEEGRTVVLVDASRSMGVEEESGKTRLDDARALLTHFPGAEIFHFGGELLAGEPTSPDQPDTDLAGALGAVAQRYAGEKLASIVLITDGVDRGGLVSRPAGGQATVDPALLPVLPGALTVYQVGRDRDVPDLAVTDLHVGNFAFLRAPLQIIADVAGSGLALDSVVVTLTRNGQPSAQKSVKLDETGHGTATFSVIPDMPGRFIFEASVPLPSGDAVPSNNALSRGVRVVRDRVRVLQVCGSPSMDQKFLRLFLKEDPGVDLVSFFILRTLEDFGSGFRSDELSLIEFPYRRLFKEELGTFDLVILQNFDYAPYFEYDAKELLANIATFVKEGGALAMLGGDRSFDLGRYAGTPLEEVLPVKLGVPGDAADPAPFTPALTPAGARHPVTRLVPDADENSASWLALPAMDGANLTLGPADGAAVLLSHPNRPQSPVLAVRQVGQGRTMALAVDSSWRWAFAEAGKGGGNQAYLRFWKNAMRWLIGDPDDQAVVVEAAHENVAPGEEQRVVVRVRDAGFAPVEGATVTGTVVGPVGSTPISATTGSEGTAAVLVPSSERGAHRVKIEAYAADGVRLGAAETAYAVVSRDPEFDRITPDGALLLALTSAVGGRFVGPGEWVEPLRSPDASRVVRDRKEMPLWAAPLWPIVAGLAGSASWWLRRRSGRR